MERCDFGSIMTIIRRYISEDKGMNQIDFTYLLFDTFMCSDEAIDFDFDNGQVCRWMTGQAKVSPRIVTYFLDKEHQLELAGNIQRHIIPLMYDSAMAAKELYELVLQDTSISEPKKQELICSYSPADIDTIHIFITRVLCFGMERNFVKRDTRTKKLLAAGNLSPVLTDFVMGNDVPRPCRHFCGCSEEIEVLHSLLEKERKVFLSGIAGIGKSELAKAYALQYKKEYTNILYLTYSGDLKQDITDMDFADDLPQDSDEERFRKHNRFLRSLKEDTLMIVDNFNATSIQDSFLSVILKYRCQILFTTRSRLDGHSCMLLEEISDKTTLLQLAGKFFSDTEEKSDVIEQIIEAVHAHTLAVELASRLLETGILEPEMLLKKLLEENVALDATDKINIIKDGQSSKETYYGHIHTLFSLYQLSETQQDVMRCLCLIPLTGIPARRFAAWLNLPDLNAVNDLIEMGFIQPKTGRTIVLHPMIQEIAVADMQPSVKTCFPLLESLQNICLLHGNDISYYRLVFQTVENIITKTTKDDISGYLLFLEDVFPYMEKYHEENGMQRILRELSSLLEDTSIGTVSDRALLLDYKATLERNIGKAVKLEKEAMSLLSPVTPENAHLVANLYGNLGGLYHQQGNTELAKQAMEQGISLLEQYQLLYMNDSIVQICNYAALLTDTGEASRGLSSLRKCARLVKEYNSDQCLDYAIIQEAMGTAYLVQADIEQATSHLKKAMAIYEIVWESEPEAIDNKYQQIQELYINAGIQIGQQLLSSTKNV